MLNDAGLSDFSERAKYGTSNRQGQNQNGYVRPLRVARKNFGPRLGRLKAAMPSRARPLA